MHERKQDKINKGKPKDQVSQNNMFAQIKDGYQGIHTVNH